MSRVRAVLSWLGLAKAEQPQYVKIDAPLLRARDGVEIAAPLPNYISSLAGGMPKWADVLLDLNAESYFRMRTNYAVMKAHRSLAVRSQRVRWSIVGTGPRADVARRALEQTRAWGDFISHLTGSLYEGTRFYQIKTSRDSTDCVAPDFFMGARHRVDAGGDIEWDGATTLVQIMQSTGVADREVRRLPFDQFAIHCPGPATTPNGWLDMGVALYNAVVEPTRRALIATTQWIEKFGVPTLMVREEFGAARPAGIQERMRANAHAAEAAVERKAVGLTSDQVIELLSGDPAGLTGLVDWLTHAEAIADDILNMGALMSSSGIATASRTGDTGEHADALDTAVFANCVSIAETFNRHVKPWINARNEALGFMPPLGKGEADWYLWPVPPQDDIDDQSIEREAPDADDDRNAPDDEDEAA